MRNREDLNDILEYYRMDDRLVRYIDRFHEEVNCPDEGGCPKEVMAKHIWQAYWEDIGGEGA